MKLVFRIFLICFLLCLTSLRLVYASVVINEVAWMGTEVSGTNEWIELFNSGTAPVSFVGWVLSIENTKDIKLQNSIDAGGFYLIERTNDDTLPANPADLVASFGTGLSNKGKTLILKDPNGTIVDKVIGGDAWAYIGGDNKSKQTANRVVEGWATRPATPKATNASKIRVVNEKETNPVVKKLETVSTKVVQADAVKKPVSTKNIPSSDISSEVSKNKVVASTDNTKVLKEENKRDIIQTIPALVERSDGVSGVLKWTLLLGGLIAVACIAYIASRFELSKKLEDRDEIDITIIE